MVRRSAVTWILMALVAIANGILRRALTEPVVGDLGAHQISAVTGSAAFLGVAYLMLHNYAGREADGTLLRVGFAWVLATEVFEFGFGHYVVGISWGDLLRDYNVAQGRLWPVVLTTLLLSPLVDKRLVNRTRSRREPLPA